MSISRFPAPHRRVATPTGVWFENDPPAGVRPVPPECASRTRLVAESTPRADDGQVMQLLDQLPRARAPASPAYAVGVLNEAGEIYREVWLWGIGEALVFTARMNASGFAQIHPPGGSAPYDGVFARR